MTKVTVPHTNKREKVLFDKLFSLLFKHDKTKSQDI